MSGLGGIVRKVPLIGDALGSILDPGAGAKKKTSQATQAWKDLAPPPQAHLSYGSQGITRDTLIALGASPQSADIMLSQHPDGNITSEDLIGWGMDPQKATDIATKAANTPGDISPYKAGPGLAAPEFKPSAAEGLTSGFADPSVHSAFADLGPSAFTDATSEGKNIGYDAGAERGQRDAAGYFSELSRTGGDPIAEADYQRRAADAEQSRKANTLAALQQVEMSGLGNAGGELTARTGSIQDATNSKYQAGLDATAAAAARRDSAATSGANISHTLGSDLEKTQTDKAAAVDKFNFYKMSGLDAAAAAKAAGIDSFTAKSLSAQDQEAIQKAGLIDATNNHATDLKYDAATKTWTRNNATTDANTELGNQTSTFNKVSAPQQAFSNSVTKTSGIAGGLNNEAGASNAAEGALVGNLKSIAGGLAGVPSGGGAVPAYQPVNTQPATPGAAPFEWPTAADPNKPKPAGY